MLINFTRTGGFAGLRLTRTVDTDTLPPEQAAEISKLITQSAFFQLPEKLLPATPRPDRFEYELSVEAEKQNHSIVVSDAACPDSLRPLLNYLTTLAMVRKKDG
jgi:hypothetical protein